MTTTKTTIPNQRYLFDIPDNVAYLNCGYMSPLLRSTQDATTQGMRYKAQPWTFAPSGFFTYVEQYRSLAGQLINTAADNIAIVPSASYGISIAANNLPLSREGEILVLEDQFPSNIYPWQEKVNSSGGAINIVARPPDGDWTAAVLQAIGPRTEILALPAVHWADGGLLDIEIIAMSARANGAKLVLDLTQSLAAMPFDIETIQPDFMVSAGYKWMLGPYALGILYVAPHWQNGEPLEHNWINRVGSEDFARLVDYKDSFQNGARRFDMGEKSNPAQLMAASAALTQILDWGVDNISYTLGLRNANIAVRAREQGLQVCADDQRGPHFIGLEFKDGVPPTLAQDLAAKNIFVSVRGNAVRITPHLYNTNADFDRLFDGLDKTS